MRLVRRVWLRGVPSASLASGKMRTPSRRISPDSRRALNEALFDAGLLPAYGTTEWQAVMATEPLTLRSRGLSESLEGHELGRALYHLAKRRHFKGRDLAEADSEEAADEKEARRDAESTIGKLSASGETLGEMLYKKTSPDDKGVRRQMLAGNGLHERSRRVHVNRSVVASEFVTPKIADDRGVRGELHRS
jgi:hypothetical protein